MAAKPKSFLKNREITPSSATDEDFLTVLGEISPSAAARQVFSQNIPVERIRPNPFQARRDFQNLEELADTIRIQGFTSRLRVRPDPNDEDYFQLLYGERRQRAARLIELREIPCDIANHTDREMIEIGLAENIQRQDLNPLEEAQAFRHFITAGYYTIRELAQRIGKNKDYVAGRLSLLQAPQDVQELVAQKPDTLTAARRIAQLESEQERRPLIEGLLKGKLNKEDVRTIVQEIKAPTFVTEENQGEVIINGRAIAAQTFVRPDVQKSPRTIETTNKRLERDAAYIITTLGQWERALSTLELITQQEMKEALQRIKVAIESIEEKLKSAT